MDSPTGVLSLAFLFGLLTSVTLLRLVHRVTLATPFDEDCRGQSRLQDRAANATNNQIFSEEIAVFFRKLSLASVVALAAFSAVEAGAPRLARLSPPGGQRGSTVEVHFVGRYLDDAHEVLVYEPGITVESVKAIEGDMTISGQRQRVEAGTRVVVSLKIDENCALGAHGLRLRTASGLSEYHRFFVGPYPTVEEDESTQKRNDKRETAKEVPFNSTVLGRMNEAADVDYYIVDAKQGQRLSAEIEATRIGTDRGVPDLHVAFLDSDGKQLAAADDSALFVQDPVLSMTAPHDGKYFVEVRHSTFNAGNETYRLHVGGFVRPTAIYPAGGQAGQELAVKVIGDPKGEWSQTVRLASLPTEDQHFVAVDPNDKLSAPTPNVLRVSPFPNVLEAEPNDTAEAATMTGTAAQLPIAFNGIIDKPGDVDCFRFTAKKGERFKIHALANELGTPLDPAIWIKPVNAKSPNPIARATDSRANQLGLPQTYGQTRSTRDPLIEFTVPNDGEYVIGIEDEQGNGGASFVYRIEVQPETDGIFTYIPLEPENRFTPQVRQAVNVPSGGKYNATVAIVNSNRPYAGELELAAIGLPDGVTMKAPRFTSGMNQVPVVFEAAEGVKPQGSLIDLVVRPVGEGKQAIPSGFRQVVAMNAYGNNDFYLHFHLNKLAFAVTQAAPFSIEVEEPKSALVQNGEMKVKFKIHRAEGYDGPVNVAMEWKPNGVSANIPTSIKTGQTEGEYLIGAARNATAGSYQVTLTTVSGVDRPGYNDGASRTYVASAPFKLTIAEPHIDAKIPRVSVERGKTSNVTVKLNHLKPFEGKAQASLIRLPRGVELVEPMREIGPEDKEVTFQLRATDECLLGTYQGVTLEVTVTDEGQAVRQLTGSGIIRVDAERGVKAAMK